MNPEEIVSFFASRGHRVVQTASCWWYNEYRQERMLQSFPLHRRVSPGADEVDEMFSNFPKALGFRFISSEDSPGQKSFIWACRRPYELNSLTANNRSHVRRGLKRCQVRSLSFTELEQLGREAHDDTLKRHDVKVSSTLGFDDTLQNCRAYEAWGAFVEGHLAAYMITLWVEDWVHILLNRSVSSYLKFYPNNAMIFSVVSELLARPGVSAVSYGLEPLNGLESLEHFKLGMGFVKEPVRQRIVVARWLKPLLNTVTCRTVEALASVRRSNLRLQKAAGVCRLIRSS